MRPFTLRGALGGGLVVLGAHIAAAQAVPAIKLAVAEKKLDQEFSAIVGLRELADGRLLVADVTEGKVFVADFKTGTVSQAGKVGQGPGEYQNPDRLYPIGADSTLMVERRTQRWHLFRGPELVKTLAPDDPAIAVVRRIVNGADARGNVIRAASFRDATAGPPPANITMPESSYVLRVNRGSAKADTLAWVKNAKSEITTQTNARGAITMMSVMRMPFSVGEELAVFEDGWVAIARVDPYRVDWISSAGKESKGARLPWTTAKITEDDVVSFLSRGRGGVPTDETRKQAATLMPKVPDALPATMIGGATPMGDGQLLIQHPPTSTAPTSRYDVVDRSGRLRGTIALPKGESIAAISAKWAYVVTTDDDGLQFISRHPWASRAVAP